MKILTVNFADRLEQHAKDFIENHSDLSTSKALVELVIADNEKYAHNTILSNRVEEAKKIESILSIINDANFWNQTIKNLTPENLRILESDTHSISTRCSKMLQYGTVNVF